MLCFTFADALASRYFLAIPIDFVAELVVVSPDYDQLRSSLSIGVERTRFPVAK